MGKEGTNRNRLIVRLFVGHAALKLLFYGAILAKRCEKDLKWLNFVRDCLPVLIKSH